MKIKKFEDFYLSTASAIAQIKKHVTPCEGYGRIFIVIIPDTSAEAPHDLFMHFSISREPYNDANYEEFFPIFSVAFEKVPLTKRGALCKPDAKSAYRWRYGIKARDLHIFKSKIQEHLKVKF